MYHYLAYTYFEKFIPSLDEFNEKLLNPDLKFEQMKRLQLMGQKMFEIYFCHASPDCIGFENDSKNQMKSIVYADTADIVRLRTSPTLFQAYDHVMDILENKMMPRFYRSPEVNIIHSKILFLVYNNKIFLPSFTN